MLRYLFVVSCRNPAPLETMRARLAGKDGVEVVLDRRYRERRRHEEPPPTERRRGDRRRHDVEATLDHLGWALVRRR